jgi:erythrocyte band 7 integral membrane protein
MAKSAHSKVIFVPMQLQSDVVGQMAGQASGSNVGALVQGDSGDNGMGAAGRAGLLNSVAQFSD